jgi:hypothetical protein
MSQQLQRLFRLHVVEMAAASWLLLDLVLLQSEAADGEAA